MITKLDRTVIRYLVALGGPKPAGHDEAACAAYLDGLDRARFEVLDTLIRKPRYAQHGPKSTAGRALWRSRDNPHRPAFA